MGCPDQITINKQLIFSITTHNPSTGTVENADALPVYRIYNSDNVQVYPAGNVVGEMVRMDESNTTGFYTCAVECTPANGFVESTNYTVYIEAIVAGKLGSISYEFEVTAVPNYEFNIDTTELIVVIRDYLRNVEVRPTRTIVGPCQRQVVEFMTPKKCP